MWAGHPAMKIMNTIGRVIFSTPIGLPADLGAIEDSQQIWLGLKGGRRWGTDGRLVTGTLPTTSLSISTHTLITPVNTLYLEFFRKIRKEGVTVTKATKLLVETASVNSVHFPWTLRGHCLKTNRRSLSPFIKVTGDTSGDSEVSCRLDQLGTTAGRFIYKCWESPRLTPCASLRCGPVLPLGQPIGTGAIPILSPDVFEVRCPHKATSIVP